MLPTLSDSINTARRLLIVGLAGIALVVCAPVAAEEHNGEFPEFTRTGADTCMRCHGDEPHVREIFQGPHAVAVDGRTPFAEGGVQCEACHGPGDEHAGRVADDEVRPPMPAFGPNATWSAERQNAVCLGCHTEQHRFWDGGAHELQDLTCGACHNSHFRRDPVTVTSTQSRVCMDCHVAQRSEFQRASAHPVRFGQMACSDCHAPHGSPNQAMLTSLTINQNCYGCHAEVRGPFLWEHAPVAEDCTHCHRPHGSNHPSMLTRRAPLLCQQCHSRAAHPGTGLTPDDRGGLQAVFLQSGSCMSCHSQVHGSNHPSGAILNR